MTSDFDPDKTSRYHVTVDGVEDGFVRDQVLAELAALFKRTPQQLASLFDGHPVAVKKDVDLDTARKYQNALVQRGCRASVRSGNGAIVDAAPRVEAPGAAIDLSIAPTVESAKGYAEDAVRNTRSLYNMNLVYSLASLQIVDMVLNEWKAAGAPLEAITKSLYSFGSFAGEVLRREGPGEWFQPENPRQYGTLDELPFLAVRLSDGRVWKPINLAFHFMMDEGIVNFYDDCKGFLNRA